MHKVNGDNDKKGSPLADQIKALFINHEEKLTRVKGLALSIRNEIKAVDDEIQRSTSVVCPSCQNVCCIEKNSFYNHEDVIYLYSLGLRTDKSEYDKEGRRSCGFLSSDGCVLDRTLRPSGCNWYICPPLYGHIEISAGREFGEFEDSMRKLASLWMDMTGEFQAVFKEITGGELTASRMSAPSFLRPDFSSFKCG